MGEKPSFTHDVFLSHSSKDKNWAHAACAVLERQRVRCWVAPRDITPGDEWGAAIIKGLNGSRIMVLIFSGHANDSGQVRREVERAISQGMTIMPIRIEDVRPEGAMEFALSNTHWLDAFTPPVERHLESIARSVKALLGHEADPLTDEESPRGFEGTRTEFSFRSPPPWAWALLAVVLLIAAILFFSRGKSEKNTMAVRAIVDRGLSFVASEDSEKAIAEFEEAIRLDPGNAEAHAGLAFACSPLGLPGDPERSLSEADKAVRLDQRSALAHAARGSMLSRPISSRDFSGALGECDESIRLNPSLALAHSIRAWVYIRRYNLESHQTGDLDLAIAESGTAIGLDPKLTTAYVIRGQARKLLGRLDQAMTDYDTALRLSPKCVRALWQRAQIKQSKGDHSGAIADCKRSIEINPNNFNAFQVRGDSFDAIGKKAQAKADHDEAERLRTQRAP